VKIVQNKKKSKKNNVVSKNAPSLDFRGKLSYLFKLKNNNNSKINSNSKKNGKHPLFKQKLEFGQRAADFIAYWGGSWHFIISLILILIIWMILNTCIVIFKWDPYPFILMNLFLSCLAALQAPIILMSQNRQTERDRLDAKYDYIVNRKAEREIQAVQKDLEEIKRILKRVDKGGKRWW
jgi:uncharacterized membrane protein